MDPTRSGPSPAGADVGMETRLHSAALTAAGISFGEERPRAKPNPGRPYVSITARMPDPVLAQRRASAVA